MSKEVDLSGFFDKGELYVIGSAVTTHERTTCCVCGNKNYMAPVTGKITRITYVPNSGFAEMGDRMQVYLDNGTCLRGDTENGVIS